jgi:hypothetical protein
VNEIVPMTPEFEGDPIVNEVTWLEHIHCTQSLLPKLKKW